MPSKRNSFASLNVSDIRRSSPRRSGNWKTERHQQESRTARRVQQLLFPRHAPASAGFDIAGASYPADATGGDYFDYIPGRDGLLDIVIGDVSGHGFGAALLMSATRAYLRALALTGKGIDEMLTLANRALVADTEDQFVTLLYARLDPLRRLLNYTSAGHLDGYVLSHRGEMKARLKSTGMPLGVMAEAEFFRRCGSRAGVKRPRLPVHGRRHGSDESRRDGFRDRSCPRRVAPESLAIRIPARSGSAPVRQGLHEARRSSR